MNYKHIIWMTAVLLLCMCSAAYAEITGIPGSVTFNEVPKTITLKVVNSTSSKQPLDILFSLPIDYTIREQPYWVEPKETKIVEIELTPRADLTGTDYTSRIRIRLGNEEIEQDVLLNFEKAEVCPVEFGLSKAEENGTIKVNVKLENKSILGRDIRLGKVELPKGWSYAAVYDNISVGKQGSANMTIDVYPNGEYEGNLLFGFGCNGFRTVEKSLEVDYRPKTITDDIADISDGITGFFTFSGFSLPWGNGGGGDGSGDGAGKDINDGEDGSGPDGDAPLAIDNELLINIGLAVAGIALLVFFVYRVSIVIKKRGGQ